MRNSNKMTKLSYLFFICFLHLYTAQKQFIFLTSAPESSNPQPDGSLTNPYFTLNQALSNYAFADNTFYSFVFLGDSSTTHYFIPENAVSNPSYQQITPKQFFQSFQN